MKIYQTRSFMVLFATTGVLLSVYNYYLNPSLWLDEAFIALNIVNKSYWELLTPLDHLQVAPILFLYVEKLFSTILEDTDYGLRLFPLLCFIGSIPLIYGVTNLLTNNTKIATLSASLFSISPTILVYSSEAKQYMTEVLTLLFLYYVFLSLKDYQGRRLILANVAGLIALFLSNTSVIVITVLGSLLAIDHYRVGQHKIAWKILLSSFGMVLLFVCYFYIIYFQHDTIMPDGTINNFSRQVSAWKELKAFMPLNPFSENFFLFSTKFLKIISEVIFGFSSKTWEWKVGAFLYLAGIVSAVVLKEFRFMALTLGPIAVHLILSSIQVYPVATRLVLYQAPLFVITTATGCYYVFRLVGRLSRCSIPTFILYLPAIFLLSSHIASLQSFDSSRHLGLKRAVQYISEQRSFQNADGKQQVYLYHYLGWAGRYYQDIGYFPKTMDVIIGDEHVDHIGATPAMLDDFAKLGLLWVIFGELDTNDDQEREQKNQILAYLDMRGEMIRKKIYPESDIYLYRIAR